jgi:nitrite reductase/ring-hydroxylating ferredoxin subunit
MGKWQSVGREGDLAEGEMKEIRIGARSTALYWIEGQYHATDNVCTHAFAHLTDGLLEGAIIERPLHGGRFDIGTGQGLAAPIVKDREVVAVRISNGDVQLMLP